MTLLYRCSHLTFPVCTFVSLLQTKWSARMANIVIFASGKSSGKMILPRLPPSSFTSKTLLVPPLPLNETILSVCSTAVLFFPTRYARIFPLVVLPPFLPHARPPFPLVRFAPTTSIWRDRCRLSVKQILRYLRPAKTLGWGAARSAPLPLAPAPIPGQGGIRSLVDTRGSLGGEHLPRFPFPPRWGFPHPRSLGAYRHAMAWAWVPSLPLSPPACQHTSDCCGWGQSPLATGSTFGYTSKNVGTRPWLLPGEVVAQLALWYTFVYVSQPIP